MRQNITALDVKKLTSCRSDWETNQYTILNKVKEWSNNLHRNKLFPSIEESIQLNLALEDILRDNIESKLWFDNEIRSRKLNERFIVYEKAHQIGNQLDKLFTFIDWALDLNKPVLEEGRVIKNFVDENLFFKRISTVERNYNGKGYFTLPNNKNQFLNIYLYEIMLDWSGDNLYQRMSSNLVKSIPAGVPSKLHAEVVRINAVRRYTTLFFIPPIVPKTLLNSSPRPEGGRSG